MHDSHDQVEDFVLDPDFQQWVYHPDEKTQRFWHQFMEDHPEKKQDMESARQVLLAFQLNQHIIAESDAKKLHQRIHEKIAGQEAPLRIGYQKPARSFFRRWQQIAAAFIGFMTLSLIGLWLLYHHPTEEYSTGYNETKTITLPDRSTVILNANSRLSLSARWDQQSDRLVSLEGEAFFRVKKKPGNKKFVVHTENVNVEVVGTRFNVNNRHARTQVVLQSGQVKLKSKLVADREIVMQPGELAAISATSQKFIQQKVHPEKYTAWTENKLVLDKTSVRAIAELLRDNYGFEVSIESKKLASRKFSATTTIPLEDVDMLLMLLEKSFNVEVIRHGHQITIKDSP